MDKTLIDLIQELQWHHREADKVMAKIVSHASNGAADEKAVAEAVAWRKRETRKVLDQCDIARRESEWQDEYAALEFRSGKQLDLWTEDEQESLARRTFNEFMFARWKRDKRNPLFRYDLLVAAFGEISEEDMRQWRAAG